MLVYFLLPELYPETGPIGAWLEQGFGSPLKCMRIRNASHGIPVRNGLVSLKQICFKSRPQLGIGSQYGWFALLPTMQCCGAGAALFGRSRSLEKRGGSGSSSRSSYDPMFEEKIEQKC